MTIDASPCHRCEHRSPPPYRGPCACTIDRRDILAHATADYCPHPSAPRFGSGVAPADWDSVPLVTITNHGKPETRTPARAKPETRRPDPLSREARQIVDAESAGLGDDVERLAHALGADKLAKVFEEITGWNCGCEARKRLLNKLPSILSWMGTKAAWSPGLSRARAAGNSDPRCR